MNDKRERRVITVDPEPIEYAIVPAPVAEPELSPAELERREKAAAEKAENRRLLYMPEGRFLLEARDARDRLKSEVDKAAELRNEADRALRAESKRHDRLFALYTLSVRTVRELERHIYGDAETSEASKAESGRGEQAEN